MRPVDRVFRYCYLMCCFIPFLIFSNSAWSADRVTVLLAFEPTKANGKKWDRGLGADPALCMNHGCYKSGGLSSDARYYPRKKIFLPAVVNPHCRNSLICIFRGVELDEDVTEIWPVDLDGFGHDRLERRLVKADDSCLVTRGSLRCLNGVFTEQYSMWLVPDNVLEEASLREIERTLSVRLYNSKDRFTKFYLRNTLTEMPDILARFYERLVGRTVPKDCTADIDVALDAFELSGLLWAHNHHTKRLVKAYLENTHPEKFQTLAEDYPKVFWKLYKMIHKMQDFARAEKVVVDTKLRGLRLRKSHHAYTLVVGERVRDHAEEIIEKCIYDTAYSK